MIALSVFEPGGGRRGEAERGQEQDDAKRNLAGELNRKCDMEENAYDRA